MRHRTAYELILTQATAGAPLRFRTCLAVLVIACSLAFGCVKPQQPIAEAPPTPQPAQPAEPQPVQMPKLPPPKLDEVQGAVKRVFKDAASIDADRKPSFVAGDFNGDQSQDIAVIVKPLPGKLPEMNEEYPAWMLKDPFVSIQPGMPRLSVRENEPLLAVIHGYGPTGWRDSQATQTYLLKNAVGSAMKTEPGKEFVAAHRGQKLPQVQGDLIGAVLHGAPGYLYYTGPSYLWYNPKAFTGEPEKRLVHGRASGAMRK
jgi:hypothetical protein